MIYMYESAQVKRIPAAEWTCVVELVKRNNVNDGFGNVTYSGIFTLLTGTLYTKGHVDLTLNIIIFVKGMPTTHYTN